MKIKVGINGMGRIGRMIVRAIIESDNKNLEIKHINNRTNSEACSTLLKYDSIHGKFDAKLDFDKNHLIINKNKISFSQETDINNINWKKTLNGQKKLSEITANLGENEKKILYKNIHFLLENYVLDYSFFKITDYNKYYAK